MNIKEAKQQVKNAITSYLMKDEYGDYRIGIEKQRPVLLLGAPGLGKTAIMEQVAQETGISLVTYSMTHHTRETAIGLPVISHRNYTGADYQITEYTMSEIIANLYDTIEATGIKEGILFLDEINCVSETLAPSMLQFLQYKVFGLHQVPSGWVVVTAGNPPEFNKSVNEFDIVTLDRLKKVEIEPDYSIWKEYAYRNSVHPAIFTYLDMYEDHFFVISSKKEDLNFVTARGWEDLSQMIILYEANKIPVDLCLVAQYLQNDTISQLFIEHYNRYNEIMKKYQVAKLLDGQATAQIIENAKAASDSEKLILTAQLVDCATQTIRQSLMTEKMSNIIMPVLQDIVAKINAGFSNRQVISEHIMDLNKKLDKAVRARVISTNDKRIQHWILASLDIYMERTTNEARDKKSAIAIIQSEFDAIINKVNMYTNKGSEQLSNTFAFFEQVYGNGVEMDDLINELAIDYPATTFMEKYGCDEYFSRISDGQPVEAEPELVEQTVE